MSQSHNKNKYFKSERPADGPLLFELLINDLFLFLCFSTLSNFAEYDNLFTTETDIQLRNKILLS